MAPSFRNFHGRLRLGALGQGLKKTIICRLGYYNLLKENSKTVYCTSQAKLKYRFLGCQLSRMLSARKTRFSRIWSSGEIFKRSFNPLFSVLPCVHNYGWFLRLRSGSSWLPNKNQRSHWFLLRSSCSASELGNGGSAGDLFFYS